MPNTSRRATLKTVADAAGVSTATVSYVLSGRGSGQAAGVTAETEARVRAAAEQLQYRPNRAARAVRTGRTGVIQLSLHMLSDPWSLGVAEAVNEAANEHGLTTVILADGDWYRALDRLECDVAYIDGVARDGRALERIEALARRGQRLVVFDEHVESSEVDIIRSRAQPGCEQAVSHVFDRYGSVGCLTAQTTRRQDGPSRYTAYTEALTERALPFREDWVEEFGQSQSSAFVAATRMLERHDRPRALYATTDFAAIAAINAAHRLGLSVPEDLAVIGVGNAPDGETVQPTLSTVGPQDFFRRQAKIIVDAALGTAGPPRVHDFPWRLIPRGSTASAASDHERAPNP